MIKTQMRRGRQSVDQRASVQLTGIGTAHRVRQHNFHRLQIGNLGSHLTEVTGRELAYGESKARLFEAYGYTFLAHKSK